MSLSRTLRDHYAELEHKLERGHTIRILLVHPDGPAIEIAASRLYPTVEAEQVSQQIQRSLDQLCELKASTPSGLEIRTIQNPLTHGITALSPDAPSGVFYIEDYPYQTEGSLLPRLIVRADDAEWFAFYKMELQKLWEGGTAWDCSLKNRP